MKRRKVWLSLKSNPDICCSAEDEVEMHEDRYAESSQSVNAASVEDKLQKMLKAFETV